MDNLSIRIDDLSDGKVEALLQEHHREMFLYSPPESIHALDTTELKHRSMTIWRADCDGSLAGCGGLKEIAPGHGEIKSMRTNKPFLKQGVGAKILTEILKEATLRAYANVSLETGTHEAFLPALALYKRFGFEECPPFGDYKLDPYSVFFTKNLGKGC